MGQSLVSNPPRRRRPRRTTPRGVPRLRERDLTPFFCGVERFFLRKRSAWSDAGLLFRYDFIIIYFTILFFLLFNQSNP